MSAAVIAASFVDAPPVFYLKPVGGSTLYKSADGATWTATTGTQPGTSNGGAWSPTLGFALADGTRLYKSTDGESWTSVIVRNSVAVAWCSGLGKFIAIGFSDSTHQAVLTDFTTNTESGPGSAAGRSVAYSPTLGLIVAGLNNGQLATSTNGTTWTTRTSGFGTVANTDAINAACWSPGLGMFVIAGGNGQMATSTSGTTWTTRTSSFGTSVIWSMAWSPTLSAFVAVGDDGKIATSTSGTSWTQRTSPFGGTSIRFVGWSEKAKVFIAAGLSGKIATSTDGTNWTLVTHSLGTGNFVGGLVKE